MKKRANNNDPSTGTITITKEDYRRQRARGLKDDEILKPGQYPYRRGSFAVLHGIPKEELREALKPQHKIGVYIKLDLDVLNFFKARAEESGAPPYQTQINAELRKVMEAAQESEGDTLKALLRARSLIETALCISCSAI